MRKEKVHNRNQAYGMYMYMYMYMPSSGKYSFSNMWSHTIESHGLKHLELAKLGLDFCLCRFTRNTIF